MWTNALLVAAGGGLGALARYGASALALRCFGKTHLWLGTGIVNLLGCVLIGALFALAQSGRLGSPQIRLFFSVGLCGAFTTFSTFSLEVVELARLDERPMALAYGLGSLVLGALAVLAGMALAGGFSARP